MRRRRSRGRRGRDTSPMCRCKQLTLRTPSNIPPSRRTASRHLQSPAGPTRESTRYCRGCKWGRRSRRRSYSLRDRASSQLQSSRDTCPACRYPASASASATAQQWEWSSATEERKCRFFHCSSSSRRRQRHSRHRKCMAARLNSRPHSCSQLGRVCSYPWCRRSPPSLVPPTCSR